MSEELASSPSLPTSFKHEIAADVTISGRLSFPGDTRVDGNLRGELRSRAVLLVGPTALLHADLHAQRIIVQGTVIGAVHASAGVEVVAGGRLIGSVAAACLVVREGAVLEGHCTIGSPAEAGETSETPAERSTTA